MNPWISALVCTGALLWAPSSRAASPHAVGEASSRSAEELVFLVQYIGTDYGGAVRDGQIVDPVEYAELVGLSGELLERYDELRPRDGVRTDLERLDGLIHGMASWAAVRGLCDDLVPRMVDTLDVVSSPSETPDLQRGFLLYGTDCAACHGLAGGGDGRSAPEMEPPPTSFRESRMDLLSPDQVFNAETLGVPGTAMPSYGDARTPQELWDVAFFVMTLRKGFDPSPPVEIVPLTLAELAAQSNEELSRRLRTARPGAGALEVDYYRANPPRVEPARSPTSSSGQPPPHDTAVDNGVEVAELLERTFSRVADMVFPSVVGISSYERDPKAALTPSPSEKWRKGGAQDPLYEGYHRVRSGSGFFVSDDGTILTSAHLISEGGNGSTAWLTDVELPGNLHLRARVIGLEPSIGLAVLKVDSPIPVHAARIGDSELVRVGNWAIAVGDPPGTAKTFVPGTISARPERVCYQEQLTSTTLQTSLAIDPEAFGGPLVDVRGQVVGIMVPMPSATANVGDRLVGPVSALPINLVMTVYRALALKESRRSPWLGISVLDLSPAMHRLESTPRTGIYIDDVFEPSPASRAGIRVGDFLVEMDGNPILGVPDFQHWLYMLGIDANVTIRIVRDGKPVELRVKIEQRPSSAIAR